MYIVRFIPKDGRFVEEYYYHREEDALYHFHLFDEESDLYDLIEIVTWT